MLKPPGSTHAEKGFFPWSLVLAGLSTSLSMQFQQHFLPSITRSNCIALCSCIVVHTMSSERFAGIRVNWDLGILEIHFGGNNDIE